MKKVGEIMEELGFNKDAPTSAKEAFIRHLVKAATGVELQPRDLTKHETPKIKESEQLSFSFDEKHPSKKAI